MILQRACDEVAAQLDGRPLPTSKEAEWWIMAVKAYPRHPDAWAYRKRYNTETNRNVIRNWLKILPSQVSEARRRAVRQLQLADECARMLRARYLNAVEDDTRNSVL